MKEKLEEIKRKIMPDGKAMILAYDQGFEHGPREFLELPESGNFEYSNTRIIFRTHVLLSDRITYLLRDLESGTVNRDLFRIF